MVVPALEQHLTLELDQLVLAGAQHQPDQFVVDVGVDLCGRRRRDGDEDWLTTTRLYGDRELLTLNSSPNRMTRSSGSFLETGWPSSWITVHSSNISWYTWMLAFFPRYSVRLPAFGL